VSSYANNIYGLVVMLIFTVILTLGFVYELGKNALKIETKQDKSRFDSPKQG
jgi:NADH-ubiquinone oxidoreductase chain 3